jgi:hypothetical protein
VIESASAVRYSGKVEQGRTQPLRAFVETSDGSQIEVILKVSDGRHLSIEGLANEMLGSLLAGDLDLPTPRPFLVELASDFIATIPDHDVRARLNAASPVAFASTVAGPQWRRWERIDRLPADRLDLALQVFAFDAFIGNPDRRPDNSNLLRHKSDGSLLLIDHETAFGFHLKLFPPVTPWTLGNLTAMGARGAESEHLFFAALSGHPDLDFEAVAAAWADLSDARLAAYVNLLPNAWAEAHPAVPRAINHVGTVRNRIGDCLNELRRVLR